MSELNVQILTPERTVRDLTAEFVVIPAYDGELGILPGHAPLLAEMKIGAIRIRKGAELELFAVSGGFVTVNHNAVVILAETAEMAEEIDVERARRAAEQAKSQLREPLDTNAMMSAEAALKRAIMRLRIAENLRRR